MLPFIVYSLQNMELFHHCEKGLLVKRGLLRTASTRDSTLTVDRHAQRYLDYLYHRILDCVSEP
jgi:4-hydroxy-tetrahydrodipicolinate synthase